MPSDAEDALIERPAHAASPPTVEQMLLQYEIEKFLYEEAALLDGRKYADWLELFAEDVRYWMPIRRTMTSKDVGREFTKLGEMSITRCLRSA